MPQKALYMHPVNYAAKLVRTKRAHSSTMINPINPIAPVSIQAYNPLIFINSSFCGEVSLDLVPKVAPIPYAI